MTFVGNLLWLSFGGWIPSFLGWVFCGVVLCITIIGIQFGLANFKFASAVFAPLGKRIVNKDMARR